jgi:GT2 family glycosyltransferase
MNQVPEPLITVAVPSYNHGHFLEDALGSIFSQDLPVEVFVADGGSQDNTLSVLKCWDSRLSGYRSHPDNGQAASINEAVAKGTAPYVAWLNSDDIYLPGGLKLLLAALEQHPEWPAAYGKAWNVDAQLKRTSKVWVQSFSKTRLANRCIISQPATIIRRSAWQAVGGLDESLHLALDYDLWWRLFTQFGPLGYVEKEIALNRNHDQTKTKTQRRRHHLESIAVVRRHYGSVPMKWWLTWPVSVWLRSWTVPQQL